MESISVRSSEVDLVKQIMWPLEDCRFECLSAALACCILLKDDMMVFLKKKKKKVSKTNKKNPISDLKHKHNLFRCSLFQNLFFFFLTLSFK